MAEANRICVAWTAGDSSSAGVSRMPARHRRVGDTVERQTGVSADKACGIAQRGIGDVKIGVRRLGGECGLSAKVQRFCRGDGA